MKQFQRVIAGLTALLMMPATLPVSAEESALTLTEGMLLPARFLKQKQFCVKGIIHSESEISSVTAGIYDMQGNFILETTAEPHSTTYELNQMNQIIRFETLPEGTYIYQVMASNATLSNYILTRQVFTCQAPAFTAPPTETTAPIETTTTEEIFTNPTAPPQSSTVATTTEEIFTNPTAPPQSSTVSTTTEEIFTNPTAPPQSSTIATTTDEIFTNPTVPPQSSTIATTTDEIFTNPTVPPQSSTVATTTDEIFTNPTVPPQSSTEATTTTEATSTTQTISTDEISISNAFTIPSSLNSSQAVSVYGLLRSSAMMQSVTAGVFDSDDELITGKTVDVNSNSYDLKSLDNDILFDSLQPDNYHFQVIVTTINGTQVVMNQNFSVKAPEGVTYINGILIVNKTYSLPSTYNPNGLLPCVQTAFNQMVNAAKGDGLSLWVASGFRSYSYQQSLYNRYVQQYGQTKADTFSARAGHSEHQTGMAIDVNNASDSFAGTKEAKWLAENCWKYGFIIRYPQEKQNITGFQYEPWHVRWLGKKWASIIYHSGLTLEEYLNIDSVYR